MIPLTTAAIAACCQVGHFTRAMVPSWSAQCNIMARTMWRIAAVNGRWWGRYAGIMPAVSTIIWVGFGIFFGYVLWKSGIAMLRSMTMLPPEPPPTGELRKISQKYRCDVCGVEIKMTMAPDDDHPPPRHCLEDMIEVAPLYD